jgi:hypothetical protein
MVLARTATVVSSPPVIGRSERFRMATCCGTTCLDRCERTIRTTSHPVCMVSSWA